MVAINDRFEHRPAGGKTPFANLFGKTHYVGDPDTVQLSKQAMEAFAKQKQQNTQAIDLDAMKITSATQAQLQVTSKQVLNYAQATVLAQGKAAAAMNQHDMDFTAADAELADAFARQQGESWGKSIAKMLPTLAGIVLAVAGMSVAALIVMSWTEAMQ